MFTVGVEPAPKTPSNVAKRVEFGHGDIAAGFAQADVIVERSFTTKPVHQGYIEPHACIASVSEDGQADLWVTDAGPLDRACALRAPARLGRRQGPRARPPRSAAASAARPSSTSSPSRWRCPRRRAGR